MSLTVPFDEMAEREVTGCAVATDLGFRIAAAVVRPADFYVPRYGRLFAACAEMADVPTTWDDAERSARAAAVADVDEREVRALVHDRGRFHDTHGYYAHRVADAAHRRRAMTVTAEVFALLGDGAGVEDAMLHLLPFIGVQSWAA